MTAGIEPFRASYASAFQRYLREASEISLRAGYELGREAVGSALSVLDLAAVHHDVLESSLARTSDSEDVGRITRAAATFLQESLSAYEMVQRGFREAQEATLLERQHAAILRRLSTFLADASLALYASDSLEEMLRLVAEQARELTGANCSLATVSQDGPEPKTIEAVSGSETDADYGALLEQVGRAALDALLVGPTRSVRMTRRDLAAHPASLAIGAQTFGGRPPPGIVAAALTTLDGRELGAIVALDKHEGDFTETDEAVLAHLAQMASAALERGRLYE
jgi:hypothetical protein